MQDVGAIIREGADAFVKRQYTTIGVLALVAAVIIGVVIALVENEQVADVPELAGGPIGALTAIAFLVGAACSMASGIIGMTISVRSNVRTAAAARRSLVEAVQVAMRGGAVSGFLVVALSLLGVWGIFTVYQVAVQRHWGQPGAVRDRRLRLRRQLRRPVRPAGRRHLHQGRRRRLRPRGQGGEGHPRGRPPQRGRDRRPRWRQRRRLRRPWGRPVRVHRRREHRRHDPGRRGLHDRAHVRLAQSRGLDLLPAGRPRLRSPGHDRRDVLHPRQRDRGPDEHPQPRLLGHDGPVRGGARDHHLRS